MTAVYDSGIHLVLVLQALGWLEAPMRFFTFVGTPDFFIFVLPVVYWCIDSGLGIRIGFILLFSSGLNEVAKLALQGPRPYWISLQVKALAAESSCGAPSGHAQIGAGIWGMVAAAIRRPWAWVLAVVVVFLIGVSRIFLGVHFPHDVLLGWLLGSLTLWAFLTFWNPLAGWIRQMTFLQQSLLAGAVSIAVLLAGGLLSHSLRDFIIPASWLANAARAGQPYPDPLSMEGILTSSGAFLGLALGLAWIGKRGGYHPSGSVWQRVMCFVIGFVGLLILYLGISLVLPSSSPSMTGYAFRLVRYATIGAWVSAGAPVVFRALRLVQG